MSYLKTSGLFDRLVEDAPFYYTSPNAPEVRDVVGTAVLAIIRGNFCREVFWQPTRLNIAFALFLSENEASLPYPIVSGKEGPHKTR